MTTQIIERSEPATCATCPYFQNFNELNGRGWCKAFDQQAKKHHQRTASCDQEIAKLDAEQTSEPETKPKPQSVECPNCSGDGCEYCGYIGLVAFDRINWSVWSSVKHQFDYRLSQSGRNSDGDVCFVVYDVFDIATNEFLGQIERYRNQRETWENSVDTYHWRIFHPELESSRFLSPQSAAIEMQRLHRKAARQKALVLATTAC